MKCASSSSTPSRARWCPRGEYSYLPPLAGEGGAQRRMGGHRSVAPLVVWLAFESHCSNITLVARHPHPPFGHLPPQSGGRYENRLRARRQQGLDLGGHLLQRLV